jgi:acetyltransferase
MDLIELRNTDRDWMPALGELFFDVVDGGGSLGFLEDVDEAQMREYWEGVFEQLGPRHRLWVAREGDRALGTVQLAICGKPNGRHRADVCKLMVHRDARRRGVAVALMATLEKTARDERLTLLVLDTEAQSPAETFYQSQGFQRTGEIPCFAASPQGELRATALYWKRLD